MKKKLFIILGLVALLVLMFVAGYYLLPPETQDEFLRKNDAAMGNYGDTYTFGSSAHRVLGAFKSPYFTDPDTGKAMENAVAVYMENAGEDDLEWLQTTYTSKTGKVYAIDRKNQKITGTVSVLRYGDYCTNILFSCGKNVQYEDIKYLILLGTTKENGEQQKLMFSLIDTLTTPIPEPKYKPVVEAYQNGPEITLDEYDRIQDGMDYITVVGIVGSEGELMSSVAIGDYYTKMYCWHGADGISTVIVTFSNGSVSLKSQAFLE